MWIDPLDGTSDFVKGNLPAVTVLIGLSIKGYSRIGIVHTPFSEEDPSLGRTVFATVEHGAFKVFFDEKKTREESLKRTPEYMEPFDVRGEPPEDYQFTVAASISHFSKELKQIIETVQPVEIKRIGGAGNKCCSVAMGTVNAYMHPVYGLSNWDLCAPETIVKAMGGYATNVLE